MDQFVEENNKIIHLGEIVIFPTGLHLIQADINKAEAYIIAEAKSILESISYFNIENIKLYTENLKQLVALHIVRQTANFIINSMRRLTENKERTSLDELGFHLTFCIPKSFFLKGIINEKFIQEMIPLIHKGCEEYKHETDENKGLKFIDEYIRIIDDLIKFEFRLT